VPANEINASKKLGGIHYEVCESPYACRVGNSYRAGTDGPATLELAPIGILFHLDLLLQDTKQTISIIQAEAGNWAVSK
jgi:hypothetical protein